MFNNHLHFFQQTFMLLKSVIRDFQIFNDGSSNKFIYLSMHISNDIESLEKCNHKSLLWRTGCNTWAMVPKREKNTIRIKLFFCWPLEFLIVIQTKVTDNPTVRGKPMGLKKTCQLVKVKFFKKYTYTYMCVCVCFR